MKKTPLESWISGKIGCARGPITREEIEHYQLAKLKETLAWATARSPFYRVHLSDLDMVALNDIDDLQSLPFTTPEDIKQNPLRFLCVSQREINRVVTLHTSGTTGEPKRIYFTLDDQELTVDFFSIGMSTFVRPGDRILILLPGERPGSVGELLARGLEGLRAVGIAHGPVKDVRNTLHVMAREKVNTLVGIPVQVLALARMWPEATGAEPPRNVLLSTDYVPGAIVRELRRIWGCEVFTHYGMTEMGYGGGVECRAHFGYHMREADLLFEIIDPATGNSVEEGKSGEVVFTTLTRRGMPLIRYRTGDISRFIPEKCPCGTMLKSMERVQGRIGGSVELGIAGDLGIADLDEALFQLPGIVDFRAVLTREKEKDRLHIEIHSMETDIEQLAGPARSAVDAIPVVRAACETQALFVSVDVLKQGSVVPGSTDKRRIVDHRCSNESPLIDGSAAVISERIHT